MRSLAILFCVLFLATTCVSQTRSRKTSGRTSTKPTASAASAEVARTRTEAATRVANQLKNLTAFLYLLGGVSKRIEEIDAAAKSTEGATVVQQNEQNKIKLRATFTDFRVGLDQLEIYFRSTPGLQSYYLKLAGSAEGAATAENLAASGRFDQAGRTMLGVANRLTDVLLIMR
jgi:hypothetical protein